MLVKSLFVCLFVWLVGWLVACLLACLVSENVLALLLVCLAGAFMRILAAVEGYGKGRSG